MSAHQIQASHYDVIVCSYQFADANVQAMEKYEIKLASYEESDNKLLLKPRKPTCGVASSAHALWGKFTVGFMDEAQNINKRSGRRHKSALKLPVKAWIMMSGSLAHNKWFDLSGYFDFIKGHPYTTHEEFLRQFSRGSYTGSSERQPTGAQLKLLQRVLQSFLIMPPADTLQLPPCHRLVFPLDLPDEQAMNVAELTQNFLQASKVEDKNATVGPQDELSSLGSAVRAQLCSLHRLLVPQIEDGDWNPDADDMCNITAETLNQQYAEEETSAAKKRIVWLEKLDACTDEELFDSIHLCTVVSLIHGIIAKSSQRIVVFSQYLRYLDLVALALRRKPGIDALRFDGTVPQSKRGEVQKQFAADGNTRPLLITAGAGGVGLNLTSGTVMVQTEEWWNANTVRQAICRLHRQRQTEEVIVVKFHINNSAIDREISRARRAKTAINEKVMAPLFHTQDGTKVVELV